MSCEAAGSIEDAIHDNRMFAERAFYCMRMARVNCGSLAADFVLAGKSAAGKARRERHFMSKNEL
jgi:hypothetical protein